MKIIHWLRFERGVSGLNSVAYGLHHLLQQCNLDTYVCTSQSRESKTFNIHGRSYTTVAWEEAMGGDKVNIIHTGVPPILNKLSNKIFMTHGSPYYGFMDEYLRNDDSFKTVCYLLENSDIVVTFNPNHVSYWSELTDPRKLRVIRGGVDLNYWNPLGERTTFLHHPSILYIEAFRPGIKDPYALLFAMKKVARECPGARLQLINIPAEKQGFWHYFVGRLKLDSIVENIVTNAYPRPETLYRGADMVIHPVRGGSISSVGCEALSCGCPTIILEGEQHTYASAKCNDHPDSMAEAIIKMWDRIQKDGAESVRGEARRIAEQHYDLGRTVSELMKLFEAEFKLKSEPKLAETQKRFGLNEGSL